MRAIKSISFTIFLFVALTVSSQEEGLTKKDSIVKSSWIFGIGFNAVDDAGSEFSDILNISDNWNIVPFPSRLSIGKYFSSGLGIEAIGSYNRYNEGKTIDDIVITEDIDYYAIDLRLSYDLNKILGETGFFDPYVGLGVGYTDANNVGRGTYNAILGFRTWFNDRIGLDFNSTGKWAMSTDNGATNHIQHAVGVVYQFGIEKGLSRKGEEKLAYLQELEKEQKRVQDSILAVEKAEKEAMEIAKRLAEEKKEKELAALKEREKMEEMAKKDAIAKKVKALGNVYFDLNSSYLSGKDKLLLDKLAGILKENPSTVLKVTSHTDSRGSEKYNLWLSEKRVNRTVSYLLDKGIAQSRLQKNALGEKQLLNHCSDGVTCTSKEHSENRRSDFNLIY